MIVQNHSDNSVEAHDESHVAPPGRSRSALPATEPAGNHGDALAQRPTVFVVDPDPVTGKMVEELLQGHKLTVRAYSSGREFFSAYAGEEPGCLVLEQRIVDISGLQIQRRLAEQNQRLPMVFVSSGLDVSTAVVLMRGGAIHVLEKPVRSIELLNAIQEAVAIDQSERHQEAQKSRVREAIAMLTLKERQFVSLAASAKSTKAIASDLNICPRAVELRRRGVMEKLGLKSPLELLRFAMLAWQECNQCLDSAEWIGE
ncbi:MAG: response regulator [Thermoguttaceae bacterium]|jgi:FixJ family two-component response regulator